ICDLERLSQSILAGAVHRRPKRKDCFRARRRGPIRRNGTNDPKTLKCQRLSRIPSEHAGNALKHRPAVREVTLNGRSLSATRIEQWKPAEDGFRLCRWG